MKRREFVKSSITAPLVAGSASFTGLAGGSQDRGNPKPEYYELRLYHLKRGPQVKRINDFFRDVDRAGFPRPVVDIAEEGPV